MAYYYFGSPFSNSLYPLGTGVYPNNGNWRDINQWYTTDGYDDKYVGWINSTNLATVFPNPATDTVICYQEVLSGVGVYSSGSWTSNNVWPGNVYVLFANTGTWTGNILGGFDIGGTANVVGNFIDLTYQSQPPSAWWNSSTGNGYFNNRVRGGSITSNLQPSLPGYLYVSGGSITGSYQLNCAYITLSNNASLSFPTANIQQMYISGNAACSANIKFSSQLSIGDNANVSGTITITTGLPQAYNFSVTGNSKIAADISRPVMGRVRYIDITGGVFTNTNPWVFGDTSYVSNVNLSVTTSKDITIYGRANVSSNFYTRFTGGTYTGNLTLIPISGQTKVSTSFTGVCTYSPAATINVVSVGNVYSIASNSLPASYGFDTGGTFSPRLTLLGLPVDILGAQIL